MKNYFLVPLILLGSVFVNAQECLNHSTDNYGSDSVNCRKNYTLYSSYFVQKSYNNASKFWWETQKICPTLKQINDNGRLVNINLYSNGAYIYKKIIKQKAKEKGYVETFFGRRLWLPEINGSNGISRAAAERAAINGPMQGTAADLIKMAMNDVDSWIKQSNEITGKMIMQVHDELIFEVKKDFAEEALTHVISLMERAVKLDIPLIVDANQGTNWNEAH